MFLIKSGCFMQEQQNQNIYDLMHHISVLTQINEHVLHVIDMDIKKLNFNSYQILMFLVNFVMVQDINQKFYE
jgi:hypothetical protein